MNKQELIDSIAEETTLPKNESRIVLDAVIAGIEKGLVTDGKVNITGFGVFSIAKRAARTARNPKTGESVEVEAKSVPKFKASKNLKDMIGE